MTFRFLLVFFIEFPWLNIDAREECNLLSIHKQLKGKEGDRGIAPHPQQRMKQKIKDQQGETEG
jgi:hypothetical protein